MQPKKIVLITTGQPSLNPRLVKEADCLANSGYEVTVLYAYWNEWGTGIDKKILPLKKWRAILTGGSPSQRFTYFISKIIYGLSLFLYKKGLKALADLAIARSAFFLIREAKKHQADLYIAHNLGALPAAVKAAKTNQAKCGFDIEDFHRYETTDDDSDIDVILKTYIENKYLPKTNYLTASSQQIGGAYQALFSGKQPVIIHNVFPVTHLPKKVYSLCTDQPVKLFWFSQTIGDKRGLNETIQALQQLKHLNFELHLLGHQSLTNKSFIDKLNQSGVNLFYHTPMQPDALTGFASQFDIGLALEPGFCTNNNLALSNKLFTYMMAGLAVIASDTPAQKSFLDDNPGIGKLYEKGNANSLAAVLNHYYHNRPSLMDDSETSLKAAHEKFNWDKEQQTFLKLVRTTLSA